MHAMHMKNMNWKYAAVSLAATDTLLGGSIARAQTTQNTVIPQVGAGGSAAQNIAILVLAGLITIGGGACLTLRLRRSAR